VKKTTLLIFLVLILASGTGAYVFGEGFLDDIINDEQEEDTQITEEKPEIVLEDLIATIFVNTDFGINEYDMEEVDSGDNNEEEVVEETFYVFQFNAYSSVGNASSYMWDFGDGNQGEGIEITHEYQNPGKYIVTLTTSNGQIKSDDQVEITVDFDGHVISDNMECTCAPTAKETTVDLKIENNVQEISGETTVTHDGNTEDCTQRLSIQQCHLRVILEIYDGSSLVSQEVLFDETFNTNSVTVNFSYSPSIDENGYNFELRLETDQIRDWHKPETFWFVKY
tara:strand:+ start:194 stop:1039 length:846 start_codon:yes stop_codon:yes gene_type:complete